jgi:hypothetical protein
VEDDDKNNTSIKYATKNKGEEPKGGWVFCFLCFCFVVGPPFYVFAKPFFILFLSPRESSY